MENLFKGTYGDRYSNILMLGKSCGDKCNRLYLPPRLSKRKIEGFKNCMNTCEAAGGLDVLLGGGGGDGTGGDDETPEEGGSNLTKIFVGFFIFLFVIILAAVIYKRYQKK